jgi:hypothetical protein
MRSPLVILIAISVALATAAQVSKSDVAVNNLAKVHPEVQWDRNSAAVAHVNCGRKAESGVLGKQANEVVIAVVSGERQDKPDLRYVPIRPDIQDGFCAMPVRTGVYRLECDSDEGPLPGCKPLKGCQALTVPDDECDGVDFCGDFSRKFLSWRH